MKQSRRKSQMKNKPKLIIFDMDGLMLDTEPLAIQGWKTAASRLNIKIPEDIYPQVIGKTRELCKTIMLEQLGPSFDFETTLALAHNHIDKYFEIHGVPLKPGLLHILDNLDEIGIKKSVATSTASNRAIHKLTLANIAHRFEAIIGGDQVPHSKPAPDIFLKAAKASGTYPSDSIVLEDSNPGAQGGFSASMRVIVIPDLVPPTETTRKQAFAICDDLYQAWDLIKSL